MQSIFLRISWVAAFWLLALSMGFGQSTMATLSGVVTDQTGAVLPGAQVNVSNTATGVARAVTSDTGGRFVVPELAPGPYEVKATMTGFQTLVRSGITLAVGQHAELTLAMQVGSVNEQVTVMAEAPLVNTNSSAVAGVVNEERIEELPLNGRDFSQLPLVEAGVAAIRNGDVTVTKGFGSRIAMGGIAAGPNGLAAGWRQPPQPVEFWNAGQLRRTDVGCRCGAGIPGSDQRLQRGPRGD